MITLRNPWSNELYYGEGSDQDDDGTFRVPVDIFKYAFGEFTILYYKDWKTSTIGKQVVDKDEAVYGSANRFSKETVCISSSTSTIPSNRQP